MDVSTRKAMSERLPRILWVTHVSWRIGHSYHNVINNAIIIPQFLLQHGPKACWCMHMRTTCWFSIKIIWMCHASDNYTVSSPDINIEDSLTLRTSPGRCMLTRPAQDNHWCTVPDRKWFDDSDHHHIEQLLVSSFLGEVIEGYNWENHERVVNGIDGILGYRGAPDLLIFVSKAHIIRKPPLTLRNREKTTQGNTIMMGPTYTIVNQAIWLI